MSEGKEEKTEHIHKIVCVKDQKTEPKHTIAVCEKEKHKVGIVCAKDQTTEPKHKVVCLKEEIKLKDSVNVQPFSVNLDIDMLNNLNSGSCVIGSTIPVANQQPEKVAVCKEGKTIKIFKIVEEKK